MWSGRSIGVRSERIGGPRTSTEAIYPFLSARAIRGRCDTVSSALGFPLTLPRPRATLGRLHLLWAGPFFLGLGDG